jgi:hypothetical protein
MIVTNTTVEPLYLAKVIFLPNAWFTPVLPPTLESTCESKVVGIWIKLTPRW